MPLQIPGQSSSYANRPIDIAESLNGTFAASSWAAIINEQRGYATVPAAMLTTKFFSATGTAPVTAFNATSKFLLNSWVSSAARAALISSSQFSIPTGRKLTGVPTTGPTLTDTRPLRRYTVSLPLHASVRGTAIVEFGMAATNGVLTNLGTTQAAVWSSDTARNAGRWEPRLRTVSGGAIVNGPDSGILLDTTFHTLGLRFTEGATPLLEWLIDGVPKHSVQGDANMPESDLTHNMFAAAGLSAVAGTTVEMDGCRFIVEELGG